MCQACTQWRMAGFIICRSMGSRMIRKDCRTGRGVAFDYEYLRKFASKISKVLTVV
jgi:hypothetical protein